MFHFAVPVLKLHGNNTPPLHYFASTAYTFYITRDAVNDIITRSNAGLRNDAI